MTINAENAIITAMCRLPSMARRAEWANSLMHAINKYPHSTQAELARYLKWTNENGGLFKTRISRVAKDLKNQRLIKEGRTGITLTGRGEKLFKHQTKEMPVK